MRSSAAIAAAAFLLVLFAGCHRDEPAATEPEPATFASTLDGSALDQYNRLSEEDGLDPEAMARFLGTDMAREWLVVLSGPASERFAATLDGEALARLDTLPRRQRRAFELIALIGNELALDWLRAESRPPVDAFAPDITHPSGLQNAPAIGKDALARYARLDIYGRTSFEYFAKVMSLEAAAESLLALGEWEEYFIQPDFRVPLPNLESTLSADEKAKLESLDPRIRDPFVESWQRGVHLYAPYPSNESAGLAFTDPKAYAAAETDREAKLRREVLRSLPLELPSIADLVSTRIAGEYEQLRPETKEQFWKQVGASYAQGLILGKGEFPPLAEKETSTYFTHKVYSWLDAQGTPGRYWSQAR